MCPQVQAHEVSDTEAPRGCGTVPASAAWHCAQHPSPCAHPPGREAPECLTGTGPRLLPCDFDRSKQLARHTQGWGGAPAPCRAVLGSVKLTPQRRWDPLSDVN